MKGQLIRSDLRRSTAQSIIIVRMLSYQIGLVQDYDLAFMPTPVWRQRVPPDPSAYCRDRQPTATILWRHYRRSILCLSPWPHSAADTMAEPEIAARVAEMNQAPHHGNECLSDA
jgi:hypothetical protein